MSDATRRAERWLRGHNARGDDMDPCCSCFTCEMATALLAAEARATQAERERDEANEAVAAAQIAVGKAGVILPADGNVAVAISRLAEERDAAREALARVQHRDNADSLEVQLALVEVGQQEIDDIDAGDLLNWLQELREARIAARRCLGEES